MPGTANWISYDVKETGFHFRLNKGVPGTMQQVMPELVQFVWDQGYDLAQLDFHVIHTGGPRVLDALRSHGGVPAEALGDSWDTLASYGNVASAAVFDVLRRVAEKPPAGSATGIIAGFGPGITMELALGTWVPDPVDALAAPGERKRRSWGSVGPSRNSRWAPSTGTGRARPSPSMTITCSAC